jgi:hypothetical protein
MRLRKSRYGGLSLALVCALTATAQPGGRYLNLKAEVLDLVFPLDVEPRPYLQKVILRFGDTDTQLTAVVYPGGRAELIRYTLAGMEAGQLSQMIMRLTESNAAVTAEEIAGKLKVEVRRSPVNYQALSDALKKLQSIRISPILPGRIAVDDSSEYEFWHDTWQESVHYVINGPGTKAPVDELVGWMIRFRSAFAHGGNASSVPEVRHRSFFAENARSTAAIVSAIRPEAGSLRKLYRGSLPGR